MKIAQYLSCGVQICVTVHFMKYGKKNILRTVAEMEFLTMKKYIYRNCYKNFRPMVL